MKVNVSGGAVLAVAGVGVALGAAFLLRNKVAAVGEALNPVSPNNIFHRAAEPIITKQVGGAPAIDYLFAGADLLNPFNESDVYARQVLFGWLDRDG